MAEIYRNSVNKAVTFSIPSSAATVVSASAVRGKSEYPAPLALQGDQTVAQIPWDITRYDGDFRLEWKFKMTGKTYGPVNPEDSFYTDGSNTSGLIPYETASEAHSIVTPMFTKSELTGWDSDFTILTDAKVAYLESLVRHIIETYTGQSFGYSHETVVIAAGPNGVYYSPTKVLAINNANYSIGDGGYSIYSLDTYTSQGYNVKIPIEAEAYEINKGWHAPRPSKTITVTGEFGWTAVPPEVKNAALYLAEAFTCDESLWRERLIKSVRAADWRFDYSESAFHSTGSLIADQLLDPYVRVGYAAV